MSRGARAAALACAVAASACGAPAIEAQPVPPSLEGTRWIAAGAKSDAQDATRLEFAREGRVSGFTGCNRLSGSYVIEQDRLEVVAATTKRACLDAGGEAERKFLAVLADRPTVRVEGRRLVLTGKSGATLVMESVAP